MIRILHLSNSIQPYDFIDTALSGLDSKHFKVRVITGEKASLRNLEEGTQRDYELRCLNIPFQRSKLHIVYQELIEEIRSFKPDIVHVHHYNEAILGFLAKLRGEVDILVIGHHYSKLIHLLPFPKRSIYLAVENLCNRIADAIVVPSEEVVDVLRLQGVRSSKITCIPYAIDPNESKTATTEGARAIREEFGLQGKRVAVAVGRLDKMKGLEYLIRSVSQIQEEFPDFKVFIIGEGPDRNRLEKLVSDLNLDDSIVFTGLSTNVMNWYLAADLVIHPSITESFCQVIVEALSVNRPVIMTPVGAAPEIIIPDERGGEFIEIGSPTSIASAVKKLLKDPALAKRLAEAGNAYVKSTFTQERVGSMYAELYGRLLANPLRSREWPQEPPAVSVIIPNFNYGRYIEAAVESALAQTRPPKEIIVVDDGSTDDSLSRLSRFGDQITVLRQNRMGVGAARNHGASVSSGNIIAFLDSDDIWTPDKLESQLRCFESDSTIGLVTCQIRKFSEGQEASKISSHALRSDDANEFLLMNREVVVNGSALLVRRQLFDELGGFDENPDLHPSEDWEFFYRAMKASRIAAVDAELVKYRIHDSNGSKDVFAGERSMRLALSKIFESDPNIPRYVQRRAWANLHAMLAGGFFRVGDYPKFIEHAFKGITKNPMTLGRYLGYPVRLFKRLVAEEA
jgi:glycosyltransferase involved in cell wall biosynthesis